MHVSATQLRGFERDGFVVARSLLSPAEDLQPVMDEWAQVLDRVAQLWVRREEQV